MTKRERKNFTKVYEGYKRDYPSLPDEAINTLTKQLIGVKS